MTFSVIIPMRNAGPTIDRAIQSVLDQTVPPQEIIVIDGHSSDDGPDKVLDIDDSRIELIRQYGIGIAAGRNQGVLISTGSHLAFLDADDEWYPDHLETLDRLIRSSPIARLYSTRYEVRFSDGTVSAPKGLRTIPPDPWEGIIPDYWRCCTASKAHPVLTSFAAVNRRAFMAVGGFPEWAPFNEDHALWARLGLRYPVAFSWHVGGIRYLDRPEKVFERYPFTKSLAEVQVLSQYLQSGTVPAEIERQARAYLGKIRLSMILRNKELLMRTIKLHLRSPDWRYFVRWWVSNKLRGSN